jgi:hypothetical protein
VNKNQTKYIQQPTKIHAAVSELYTSPSKPIQQLPIDIHNLSKPQLVNTYNREKNTFNNYKIPPTVPQNYIQHMG